MNEPPPVKPGHVRRTASIFWRAGAYPFEGKGTFEMGPEDNRRAVERFAPVQFDYAHKQGPLDGKLGEVVALFPASADFSELGYHADIPIWLDQLHRDEQGNPLPLNVSATWGWTGKELRRVALVNEPRIPEAAMFEACFEATADPAVGAAIGMNRAQELDPDALDPGHTATLLVTIDPEDPDGEKKLRTLREMASHMGCAVEEGTDEPDEDDQPPVTPNPAEEEMPAPVQAAFEREIADLKRRDAARERELADLKKSEQERSARDREAHFEAVKSNAHRDALAFARQVVPSRVYPYQRAALVAEFVQAVLDDARHPEEVHFDKVGDDGRPAPVTGTRVEALRARYLALPDTGLVGEQVPDREEARFDLASGNTSASPAAVNKILASCDLGRLALKQRVGSNGHNKN